MITNFGSESVWTWNAIGKRRGAWMLGPDASETDKGFLLNHAIAEFLPADGDGRRRSNSDPVTGQAAWFDLRVRITKAHAADADMAAPQFPALHPPPSMTMPPKVSNFGAEFRRRREGHR